MSTLLLNGVNKAVVAAVTEHTYRNGKAGCALYNRNQCATVTFANNPVNFPITHSTFIINNLWPLIVTYTALNKPSACFFMLSE
jgi:hypothetical protein